MNQRNIRLLRVDYLYKQVSKDWEIDVRTTKQRLFKCRHLICRIIYGAKIVKLTSV